MWREKGRDERRDEVMEEEIGVWRKEKGQKEGCMEMGEER